MTSGAPIIHEDGTLRQAYCRNVHVVAWYDAPSLEQMHAYGAAAKALSARWEGKSALMNIVVTGVPRFSSEVREAAAEYTREGAHTVGAAHIILVGGLLGSSVRAFLSTAMLLGRPPNPTKVFGSIDEAALWMGRNLAERSAEAWDPSELAEVCRAVVERREHAAM
ncbi:MAG: hypothetical protein M5U28_04950 [Sandaracinaceae bacterium]|nr:hypothetical protein [Sandaracinaceae bacterium]